MPRFCGPVNLAAVRAYRHFEKNSIHSVSYPSLQVPATSQEFSQEGSQHLKTKLSNFRSGPQRSPAREMALYAVPQAVVYRSWAAGAAASGGTTTRRLLLRNSDPSQSISFRLTLPSSAALRVSGACVKRATFDNISSVDLPPGGTEVLVVELLHDAAASDGRTEIIDELLLRTHGETVHVPLVALRDEQVPKGGEPAERRSAPSAHEHWDEDNSDDDERPICSSHGRPSSRPSSAAGAGGAATRQRGSIEELVTAGLPVLLTPAGCTEQDELDFYRTMLADDVKARAVAVPPPAAPPPKPAAPPAPPAPPAPRMRLVQLDTASMPSGGATDDEEGAVAAPPAGELDEELAFYRSFVAAKKQSARVEAASEGAAPAGTGLGTAPAGPRPPPRVPPSVAQRDARKALAEGTFFVLSGTVHDSRGRELGPVREVLGDEYAEEPAAGAVHADADVDDDASYAGGTEEWPFADHAAGRGRKGGGGSMRDAAALGALHNAGLTELRKVLCDADGEENGIATRTELLRGPWVPGGANSLPSAAELAATKGGTIKGGGNVVRSSAPKSKLSAAEMEDNWAKLS